MNNFNLEGVGRINGGEFDNITIGGVSTCSDKIKADNFRIEGVFNTSGEVEAGILYCKGVSDFRANIRAKKITVEGVVNVKSPAKIEAEEIICSGVLKTGGEISADIVNAEGCIEADEIVGDQVSINSHFHGVFFNWFSRNRSRVRFIEATTIFLKEVKAETVNGRDIKIGPNCKIDNIDCNGTLSIDSTSTVGNITGNYTKK